MATQDPDSIVLTVGHSTRSLAGFIDLLKAHTVVRLIEVRTVPRSRHNPQYNIDTLPVALVGPRPRDFPEHRPDPRGASSASSMRIVDAFALRSWHFGALLSWPRRAGVSPR